MLQKQVQLTKVNTMADGTIRLTIDLLNGNADDIKAAYELREEETTMILVPTDSLADKPDEESYENLSE